MRNVITCTSYSPPLPLDPNWVTTYWNSGINRCNQFTIYRGYN